MANVKKAFTGESNDLVDPFVQVSFAGLTVSDLNLKIYRNRNKLIFDYFGIFKCLHFFLFYE